MTNKILCAVNGSAHSQKALDVASKIACGCNLPLILALVNEHSHGRARYSDDDVKGILDRASSAAKHAGVKHLTRVVFDSADVSGALIECAKKMEADHIVIGSGDPPFIGRLLMGSVSEAIMKTAACTVTVAR